MKTVIIIIYRKDKKILLQHRTDNAKRFPDMLGFFGGGVEKGESLIKAVKRECKEELGYNLKKPLLVYRTWMGKMKVYIFIEKYDPSKKLNLGEGKGMVWLKIGDSKESKIAPHVLRITKKIEEIINKQT